MEDSFDSTYIIRKEHYDEFIEDAEKVAITAYTVPAFVKVELYNMIDKAMIDLDIPSTRYKKVRVIYHSDEAVGKLKEMLPSEWAPYIIFDKIKEENTDEASASIQDQAENDR